DDHQLEKLKELYQRAETALDDFRLTMFRRLGRHANCIQLGPLQEEWYDTGISIGVASLLQAAWRAPDAPEKGSDNPAGGARGTIAELKAWTRKLEVGRPNGDDKLIASQSALTATVTSTTRSTRKTQSKASSAAHSNDVNDHQGPKAILINPSSPNPMIE